jgi:hypothetical protein
MKRTKILLLAALVVLGLLGFGLWYFGFKSNAAIAEWKRNAIAKIEARVADQAWLESERKKLAAEASSTDQSPGASWVGDELLTTQNGDWMICQSIATKENKLGIHQDLFIALGSDHRWYYSSFHFCISKISIMIDPQVENLADLVEAYWMVPFDGKSDDCLKPTWHSESWGQSLLDERRK